jgi:hypothetical protein
MGCHLAVLGIPGRKFTKMVIIDYPVRVRRITNEEADLYSRDLPDWAPSRLARRMLDTGRRFGITKSAREILKAALKTTTVPEKPKGLASLTKRREWARRNQK